MEGASRFLHSGVRARIIARGLSFRPDAVVANGDHVYWDLRSGTLDRLGMSPAGVAFAGTSTARCLCWARGTKPC